MAEYKKLSQDERLKHVTQLIRTGEEITPSMLDKLNKPE